MRMRLSNDSRLAAWCCLPPNMTFLVEIALLEINTICLHLISILQILKLKMRCWVLLFTSFFSLLALTSADMEEASWSKVWFGQIFNRSWSKYQAVENYFSSSTPALLSGVLGFGSTPALVASILGRQEEPEDRIGIILHRRGWQCGKENPDYPPQFVVFSNILNLEISAIVSNEQ